MKKIKWVLAICMSISNPMNLFASEKQAPPQTFVIFGVTGDLTKRGLVPALLRLVQKEKISDEFACIGVGLGQDNLDLFRSDLASFLSPHQRVLWEQWSKKFHLVAGNFEHTETYENLSKLLKQHPGEKTFYLAIPPSYFSFVIEQLHKHSLLEEDEGPVRVVIEKPFGLDLSSALELQRTLSNCLNDAQVYRMDHFLGIGIVRQLCSLRFSNPLIEKIWNRQHIDSISLTISEDMGIGTRGHFWEQTGYLRDVVQNHMMQLVALIGMEKPDPLFPNSIQKEKQRLLQAIRPIPAEQTAAFIRRGQYGAGLVQGKPVVGYREEGNVPADSDKETAIVAKLFIDNERWRDVPFYLKGGKRLEEDRLEIVVSFKPSVKDGPSNQLVFQIQPKEEIYLIVNIPDPGAESNLQPHKLIFPLEKEGASSMPGAYEFLLSEVMRGHQSHFVSFEEIATSWELFSPVFDSWKNGSSNELVEYEAGSTGPAFP